MLILIIILHALFAAVFPLAKEAVSVSDPIFFTGIRMIVGSLFLIAYNYIQNGNILPNWRKNIGYIFLLAFFNIFITNALEFWSLKYLISAKAAFLYSACPFLSAIFSYFFFNECMTRGKFLGMLIGSIGFAMILLSHSSIEDLVGSFGFISYPELAIIIASLATVFGWTLLRYLVSFTNVDAIQANGTSMFLGGIMSLVVSPFFETWRPLPIYNFNSFFVYLFLIIILSNIICYNLYGYLLKKYTSTLISFVGFIEPLCAAFYGWILLGETVTLKFFLASIIVFFGLFIFYKDELKQGYIKSS